MPKTFIKIDGITALLKKVGPERATLAGEEIIRRLREGAILIEAEAKKNLTGTGVKRISSGRIGGREYHAGEAAGVVTDRLRSSITHTPPYRIERYVVIDVGTNVEYAAFVEFGTGRRGSDSKLFPSAQEAMSQMGYIHGGVPGMEARPFLFPAFEKYITSGVLTGPMLDAVVKILTKD